ncbi:hypothetical protein A2715_00300 [Candidatus Woesebacteria bacterium RIFCSPHIGHO2_01_FULL_39_32]|uniref:Uncharacterized protein n=2 Tax=Candidatus Woeseibacteriota TaxID=1752722 RepID=A0A0G0SYG1_9BACT|nr:MAG: hypothetical protein UT61_C0004G0039 [Candidatus Woesebacteria bacterium GW2011_GWA1_39_8]OGM03801.1 MAG: hypothetical protein A2124_00420 [Candidatus Woesebacteria bacterium GWB1_37_5]OGM24266.1 MAG: hypothetical protein A2715_00300 [Candidatus Woesebacteria bacterium RIFCSPHIGHO2_01_FULL_39_32]OGM35393.1 MAG: hypothetical protein A3F01_04655 [Candidatus Woesebacteria bacterium RIFCSPHIGHO2_12_FULL_38_11]OGM65337.1 MAG: hypothetical protein A2893_01255 [Candidatus Woesebacteria bacteri
MNILKKLLRFIAEYFVFVGGLLFIFVIGILYAYIRPEGIIFNAIFLIIVIGWIVFLIKYFWEILDNNKNSPKNP